LVDGPSSTDKLSNQVSNFVRVGSVHFQLELSKMGRPISPQFWAGPGLKKLAQRHTRAFLAHTKRVGPGWPIGLRVGPSLLSNLIFVKKIVYF